MGGSPIKATRSRSAVICIGLIAFLAILLATAWMSDDAYFSFRPVDNLVHGHGLTWNPGERVQSFTNPLWTLLLVPIHFVYSEIYYSALLISILLSLTAVFIILRWNAESPMSALIVLLPLLLSKPFIDFSTSGLENPLSHFLVAVFFTIYFIKEWNHRTLFHLALVAALGTVTRLDTLLLYLPALGLVFWRLRSWPAVRALVLGFLPLIAWEAFSIVYYGFPFPNTYYAKLSTGIDGGALRLQGLRYLADACRFHPLMMLALVAAIVIPAMVRNVRALTAAAGILCYVLYVVNVGGDFMSGRFFTVPLVVAVVVMAQQPIPTTGLRAQAVIGAVLVAGSIPWIMGRGLGQTQEIAPNPMGIIDECAFWTPSTGLRNNLGFPEPTHLPWAKFGKALRSDTAKVFVGGNGMIGYYAGPGVSVVDLDALSDPLLSRLPTVEKRYWRIGHFKRAVPLGYVESLRSGKNEILDSNLAGYYDHLCVLTRSDIFSWARFAEIIRFNLKAYDSLVRQYETAPRIEVHYSEFSEPRQAGSWWWAHGQQVIRQNGMSVQLDSVVHCLKVELSVDRDDNYVMVYFLKEKETGRAEIACDPVPGGLLRVDRLNVPQSAVAAGYDRIGIYPTGGDDRYSVGHLRLLDPEI